MWFNSAGASSDGVATVIDLGEYRSPEFVGYSVRFEYEGFEISTSHDGEGRQPSRSSTLRAVKS